ncbi:MAG: hypothetical protein VCB78_01645 [Myxococcota bacterium]
MAAKQKRGLMIVGLVLMLAAIFSYVATLDESDPEALPVAEGSWGAEGAETE